MAEHRHPSEKPHPQPIFYVFIGVVLTVITAIEVAAFYADVSGAVLIPIFIALSVLKFWMVVAFFMHLKYDHRIFSTFFTGGLMLAIGVALGLIALFQNFDLGNANVATVGDDHAPAAEETSTPVPLTPTPTLTPTETEEPTTGGDGAKVFAAKGCGSCHTIDSVPGAADAVGPQLDGVASRAGSRKPGLSAEGYIRESIETPGAFVVEGFANIMPPLRGSMTDVEFESLVAFLLTLN